LKKTQNKRSDHEGHKKDGSMKIMKDMKKREHLQILFLQALSMDCHPGASRDPFHNHSCLLRDHASTGKMTNCR
jgi:hypothetical protein